MRLHGETGPRETGNTVPTRRPTPIEGSWSGLLMEVSFDINAMKNATSRLSPQFLTFGIMNSQIILSGQTLSN